MRCSLWKTSIYKICFGVKPHLVQTSTKIINIHCYAKLSKTCWHPPSPLIFTSLEVSMAIVIAGLSEGKGIFREVKGFPTTMVGMNKAAGNVYAFLFFHSQAGLSYQGIWWLTESKARQQEQAGAQGNSNNQWSNRGRWKVPVEARTWQAGWIKRLDLWQPQYVFW